MGFVCMYENVCVCVCTHSSKKLHTEFPEDPHALAHARSINQSSGIIDTNQLINRSDQLADESKKLVLSSNAARFLTEL